MARVDYLARIRTSGISAMMSLMCAECFRAGERQGLAFFGVDPNGRTLMDHQFAQEIWQAAVKHVAKQHGWQMIQGKNDRWQVRPGDRTKID